MAKLSYTPREAAEETGLSEDTIRAAIRAGDLRLTPVVVNGRTLKKHIISHGDLEKWLAIMPAGRAS